MKLENKRQEIYEGLKGIGEEIASFYKDGIKILEDTEITTKTYLLAHIAREIDGGLRQIFAPANESEKISKSIDNDNLGEFKDHKGHIASILTALNTSIDTPLAKTWINVATKFIKFAHRQGPWKEPRDNKIIVDVWLNYEKVLHALIGNYLNSLNRIDRILQFEEPSREILQTLPNLLYHPSRSEYFFRNLQQIGWLIPLFELDYFNPNSSLKQQLYNEKERNHSLLFIAEFEYLERVSKDTKINKKHIDVLFQIINLFIDYRDQEDKPINNTYIIWYILKLSFNLPIDRIKTKHFLLLKKGLIFDNNFSLIPDLIENSIFPTLVSANDKTKLLELLNIILDYTTINDSYYDRYKPLMDQYWLLNSLNKYNKDISRICGIKVVELAFAKIGAIINSDVNLFNVMHINEIETAGEDAYSNNYESILLKFLKDMLFFLEPEITLSTIKYLSNSTLTIYKRLSVYIIDKHYVKMNDIFWASYERLLENTDLYHETYNLLKNNSHLFSQIQITKILNWIKSYNYLSEIPKSLSENEVLLINIDKKREWLSTLLSTKSKLVLSYNEELENINNNPIKNPGKLFTNEFSFGVRPPVDISKIRNLTNSEIIKVLDQEYKNEQWNFRDQGLSGLLLTMVKENPDKFINDLDLFLNCRLEYLYSILNGLFDSYKEGKFIDFKVIINFLLKVLSDDNLWVIEYKFIPYTREWLISSISEFIIYLTKNDNNPLSKEKFKLFLPLLLLLANKSRNYNVTQIEGVTNEVLNSPRGDVFKAIIEYSLQNARLHLKEEEDKWIKDIEIDFTNRLDKDYDKTLDFSNIIGLYLPCLYFLNKNWVIDNFNQIFPKNNDLHWEAAISGFCYNSKFYKFVYDLFKINNHFEKALKFRFHDKNVGERIIEYICYAYNHDIEKLNDSNSLINVLLNNGNPNQLYEIIRYFSLAKTSIQVNNEKLISLGKLIYEKVETNIDNIDYQKVVSAMARWLHFVDKIDQELFEYLKLTSKYIQVNFNINSLIKYFTKLSEVNPFEVGTLFIIAIKNMKILPSYPQDLIIKIIDNLYLRNERELANEVCNIYAENGYVFLRDSYEKYNGI